MSNVAVFFDIQNLYHSSKTYGGSKISYRELLDAIGKDRNILTAKAYAAHKDEKSSKSFYDALETLNVSVLSKRVRRDRDQAKVIPVHFDVEMAVDVMDSITRDTHPDTIVLCTGNGNFSYLIDFIINEDIKVEIWSFKQSTSESLVSNPNVKFVNIPSSCLMKQKEEVKEEVKV